LWVAPPTKAENTRSTLTSAESERSTIGPVPQSGPFDGLLARTAARSIRTSRTSKGSPAGSIVSKCAPERSGIGSPIRHNNFQYSLTEHPTGDSANLLVNFLQRADRVLPAVTRQRWAVMLRVGGFPSPRRDRLPPHAARGNQLVHGDDERCQACGRGDSLGSDGCRSTGPRWVGNQRRPKLKRSCVGTATAAT